MARRKPFAAQGIFVIYLVVLAVATITHLQADVVAVDDKANRVTLAAPASRIVSLAPHATELLFSAGAGDQIVGTVAHSDYPDAAKSIPRLGDAVNLDIERILALAPQLLVVWETGIPANQHARLKSLGIPIFLSQPETLQSIAQSVINLGRLAGTEEQAKIAAGRYAEQLKVAQLKYQANPRRRVFYQIWAHPLMTISGKHLISEVIEFCGGENIFSDLEPLVPTVSIEAVIKENPDRILISSVNNHPAADGDQWADWKMLRAVREGGVKYIPWSEISRPTMRVVQAVEAVCDALR